MKIRGAVQKRKAYDIFIFWVSPILVSAATFGTCYFLGVELSSSNVFTFIATFNVSFTRIVKFLEAELKAGKGEEALINDISGIVSFELADLPWNENLSKPTLSNINLALKLGSKIAICGEVGSGKSILLAAILGEVSVTHGTVSTYINL